MIAPLRKQSDDGATYFRPKEIEDALAALYQLPIAEVARRASIDDPEHPEYVRSECVLHFVRQSKTNGDTKPYQDLFTVLWTRVTSAIPVRLRKVTGLSKLGEVDSEEHIQEKVLGKFVELLSLDRLNYDERLDFYEIRFNSAIFSLKSTARRSVWSNESHREPVAYDGDGTDLSLEMEEALERVRNPNGKTNDDFLYRLRFLDAISSLPPDQRRVIELLLEEVPIDSEDPEVRTISKILGCVEKTVRNRRDRAYAAIREALKEEKVA